MEITPQLCGTMDEHYKVMLELPSDPISQVKRQNEIVESMIQLREEQGFYLRAFNAFNQYIVTSKQITQELDTMAISKKQQAKEEILKLKNARIKYWKLENE